VPWEERVRSRRGSSAGQDPDWNRGPAERTKLATLERKGKEERNLEGRAASLSRKGSNAATLAKRRESNPDESQHFLSLQLFTAHAEPSLDEYLPVAKQLELENKHRDEEDTTRETHHTLIFLPHPFFSKYDQCLSPPDCFLFLSFLRWCSKMGGSFV